MVQQVKGATRWKSLGTTRLLIHDLTPRYLENKWVVAELSWKCHFFHHISCFVSALERSSQFGCWPAIATSCESAVTLGVIYDMYNIHTGKLPVCREQRQWSWNGRGHKVTGETICSCYCGNNNIRKRNQRIIQCNIHKHGFRHQCLPGRQVEKEETSFFWYSEIV